MAQSCSAAARSTEIGVLAGCGPDPGCGCALAILGAIEKRAIVAATPTHVIPGSRRWSILRVNARRARGADEEAASNAHGVGHQASIHRASVTTATAPGAAGAAIGAFTRATLVLLKAAFAQVLVVDHRASREIAALVCADYNTAARTRGESDGDQHDELRHPITVPIRMQHDECVRLDHRLRGQQRDRIGHTKLRARSIRALRAFR